ncbi:MAG TPA: NapC/NirT family cytochrome c [Acidisarcina sp.]|nr:NapC/NirT family cytochrome c [Acidisarcina sp.]
MAGRFKEKWLQPFFHLGKNPISLIGAGLTSASALTLLGFWCLQVLGHVAINPYQGIIFFLILPVLFIFGLILIPIGIYQRRKHLKQAGMLPSVYPKIDLADPVLLRAFDMVLLATIVNLLIVGMASYRGVSYMDTPQFCGQSCHVVMRPEFTAYQVSSHSHVDCVACHVGEGAGSYVRAKVNGTKQLIEVGLNNYPRPIHSPVLSLRPAREICEGCHTPAKYIGEKMLVKTSFADDETNTMTKTLVLLHLGGRDSVSHLTGIHGVHLGHIEYISTDPQRQVIPWVSRRNPDGSTTEFVSADATGPVKGEKRVMDCIDCHNRAAHTFQTPEDAVNRIMAEGGISPTLPFVHKEGLELLKGTYASQADAETKIKAGLESFYRSQRPEVLSAHADLVKQAAASLYSIYKVNVFPDMKVTWGTHPNNVGHTSYPGCFRCHDGSHNAKSGQAITQDCAACHNLLAVDEAKPKLLTEIGMQ